MSTDVNLWTRWSHQGDAEAFNEIVQRHGGMVLGVCRRILRDSASAEDAAQECFVKLLDADTRPGDCLGAWLHVVATRRALNYRRGELARKRREQAYAAMTGRPTAMEWDDVSAFVDEAIAELPERLRAPLILHFFERLTHEETAHRLGLSRTTVTYRLQRAVEGVRKHLRRRKVVLTGTVLAGWLTAQASSHAMPPALAAALARAAIAGPITAGAAAAVEAGFAMHLAQILSMKPVSLIFACLVALAGATTFVLLTSEHPSQAQVEHQPPAAIPAAPERPENLPPDPVPTSPTGPTAAPDSPPPDPPQEPAPPRKDDVPRKNGKPPANKARVEQVLQSPISIEFERIRMAEILEFISDSWAVNIVVDEADAPPGPAEPDQRLDGMVPYIHFKDAPLRDALGSLLPPLGLDYQVRPSYLWISTPEAIASESAEWPAVGSKAMEALLDTTVSLEFNDNHVSDTLQFIADSWNVNLVLDWRLVAPRRPAPKQHTHPEDALIETITLKGVPLQDALDALVRLTNLAYSVEDGFLFFGRPERIRQRLFAARGKKAIDGVVDSCQFGACTLDEVLRWLGAQAKPKLLPVYIDNTVVAHPAAEAADRYPCDGQVRQFRMKNAPLSTVLDALLVPRGLDYAVVDDAIRVSTAMSIALGRCDQGSYRQAGDPNPPEAARIDSESTAELQ